MQKLNVLYVAHGLNDYGGAAKSLLNLISSVSDHVNPIVVSNEDGVFVETLRSKGIECLIQPFNLIIEYKKDLNYYLHLLPTYLHNRRKEQTLALLAANSLAGRKIDIVHCNSSAFTFGHELSKQLGSKLIWHIREFLDLDFNYKVLFGRRRLKRMINTADARICISNAVASHWGFKDKNTFILGNAVASQSDFFFSKEKEPYILFCSSYLTDMKGTKDCIKAFAQSMVWQKGIKLRIFGRCKPHYRKELDSLIEGLSISPYIEINEFCPDLRNQYRHASLYIMSSRNEALGRVTIEAIINGCPVIAYASGGTLDIIEDGKTGFLYDSLDECASLMRSLASADNSEIVRNAQKHSYIFTEEYYQKKIIEIYNSVL